MSTANIKAIVPVYDMGKRQLSLPKKGQQPVAVRVTFHAFDGHEGAQGERLSVYEYRDAQAIKSIMRGGDPAAFRGRRIV